MPSSSACRIDTVLDCISDRWTLGIIHKLSDGPRRTLDLYGAFKGMSSKTLNARLKKLERDGVVIRHSYPESPPRVEYSLTGKGRELLPVLKAIAQVAFRWDDEEGISQEEPACRACAALYDERRLEETRPLTVPEEDSPQARPPAGQKRSRKITDVTLL
ncbi:MAG: helix-turn-helix transcriptional regulator [Blastocatellia bacterium]|nr:helix-turn-helix transcriptional regulator [Blastocatellia bacterium]